MKYGQYINDKDIEIIRKRLFKRFRKRVGYLFYKKDGAYYKTYCTCCKRELIKKENPNKLTNCPDCKRIVTTRMWGQWRTYKTARNRYNSEFIYTYFKKISYDKIVLFSAKCEYNFEGNVGSERFDIYPYIETVLTPDRAKAYNLEYGGRYQCNKVKQPVWNEGYFGYKSVTLITEEIKIKNTFLKYSQINFALEENIDVFEYLDYYIKNPCIEMLIKGGYREWVAQRFKGYKKEFRTVVNVKAKDKSKMFKLFTKAELKIIKNYHINTAYRVAGLRLMCMEHKSMEANISVVEHLSYEKFNELMDIAKRGIVPSSRIIRYIEGQRKKSNMSAALVAMDYLDYINQLEVLDIACEKNILPRDLHLSHQRLSQRINEITKAKKNIASRIDKSRYRNIRKCLKHTKFEHQGLFIRVLDSEEEFLAEGEQNANCVYGYRGKHLARQSYIFVIRETQNRESSLYTVEIDAKTFEIKQCRGYENKDYDEEVTLIKDEFIKKWQNHLDKKKGK